MFSFFQDIRFAIRDLRKGFLVTSLAVLSLALAGNTTVFGFVNALLFRPLPYPEIASCFSASVKRMRRPHSWLRRRTSSTGASGIAHSWTSPAFARHR